MNTRASSQRSVTLERLTYGVAIRNAARLGGAFKKREVGRQVVVVLPLPLGANFDEYEAAATILVHDVEALRGFRITSPKTSRKGALDLDTVHAELRRGPSLLIVWPSGYDVPREIAVAADRVVEVDPVRPFHLVAAARMIAGQVLELKDAERMLQYPPSAMFAAFRPGRPAAMVLKRLAEVPVLSTSNDCPRLEDLVGYGDAKDWGMSLAQDIREWREGKLAWLEVDRGLLLSGPTGTGKTLFAGALARSCEANLVATSVARWQSAGYLSDVLRAMRESFQQAVAQKPCILFLDEIDAIGDRARIRGREHENYWTQVVNLLLELMDGHDKLEGVVVVGATNYPDVIDPALRRPGRLDRHMKISLPDTQERKQLARVYFGQHLSDGDVEAIAAATVGFTGAAFEQAGRQARRKARRCGREVDLQMVMQNLPPARPLESARRRTIAVHEAAHALVGLHLGIGTLDAVVVSWETRDPHQPPGFAHFTFTNDVEPDRQLYLDRIAVLLAGRAAEEEILGTAFEGAGGVEGSDLHNATEIATMIEASFGMGEGLSYFESSTPAARARLIRSNSHLAERVERVLASQMERSRTIVRERRISVEAIAHALETRGHLKGREVAEIVAANRVQGGEP